MGFIYDPFKSDIKQAGKKLPTWYLLIVIARAPVVLECTVVDCD